METVDKEHVKKNATTTSQIGTKMQQLDVEEEVAYCTASTVWIKPMANFTSLGK